MGAHVSVHIIWARHEHIYFLLPYGYSIIHSLPFPSLSLADFLLLFFTFLLLLRLLFLFNVLWHTFGHKSDFSYVPTEWWMRRRRQRCHSNAYACLTSTIPEPKYGKRNIKEKNERKKFASKKKNHLIFSSIWFSFGLGAPSSTLSCRFLHATLLWRMWVYIVYTYGIYMLMDCHRRSSLGMARY